MPEETPTEAMLAMRGELAALQYKRDKLLQELTEMRTQVRCKEQKTIEIEGEADRLREHSARQSAVVSTLKQRLQVGKHRE